MGACEAGGEFDEWAGVDVIAEEAVGCLILLEHRFVGG